MGLCKASKKILSRDGYSGFQIILSDFATEQGARRAISLCPRATNNTNDDEHPQGALRSTVSSHWHWGAKDARILGRLHLLASDVATTSATCPSSPHCEVASFDPITMALSIRYSIFPLLAFLFASSAATPRSVQQTADLPGAGVYPQCTEAAESAQFNVGQACVGCVQEGQDCPPQCCAQDLADGQVLLCVVGSCCNRVVLTNDGGVIYGMEALRASDRGALGICSGVGPVPTLQEDAFEGCGRCAAGFRDKDDSQSIVDCREVGYEMPAFTEPGRSLPSTCANGSGESGGTVVIGESSQSTPGPSAGDSTSGSGGGIVVAQGDVSSEAPSTSQVEDGSSDRDDSIEDASCFPGDASVDLADGTKRLMKDVAVGDIVRVGQNTFSPVFMFTHRLSGGNRTFLRISTSTGEALDVTKGHYMYINGALTAAKNANVGDALLRATGEVTQIRAIGTVQGSGLYNPQTLSGDLVVDNLMVSTYTTAVAPSLAHALLSPLRILSRAGFCMRTLEKGAPKVILTLASQFVQ